MTTDMCVPPTTHPPAHLARPQDLNRDVARIDTIPTQFLDTIKVLQCRYYGVLWYHRRGARLLLRRRRGGHDRARGDAHALRCSPGGAGVLPPPTLPAVHAAARQILPQGPRHLEGATYPSLPSHLTPPPCPPGPAGLAQLHRDQVLRVQGQSAVEEHPQVHQGGAAGPEGGGVGLDVEKGMLVCLGRGCRLAHCVCMC